MEYLEFTLRGRNFAVPTRDLVEVTRPCTITPVEGCPPQFAGLINLRGTLLAVLDLPVIWDQLPITLSEKSRFLILKPPSDLPPDVPRERVALAVDAISDIRRLTELREAPNLPEKLQRHVAAISEETGTLLHALDLRTIGRGDLDPNETCEDDPTHAAA